MVILQCATIIVLAIITLYLMVVRLVITAKENKKNTVSRLAEEIREEQEERENMGYKNTYLNATNMLFESIHTLAKEWEEHDFTPCDVTFGNGYFIFEFGENSVVHFHIKELPGWLFGIWWEPRTEEIKLKKKDCFKRQKVKGSCVGTIFAQWEDEIDKFKPSRSVFKESITYVDGKTDEWFAYNVLDMLLFMLKEPHISYFMDYTETDLNRQYVTREDAKKLYDEETSWREEEIKCNQEYIDGTYNKLHKLFKRYIDRGVAEIVDHGENFSPRFDILLSNVLPIGGKIEVVEEGDVTFDGLVDEGIISKDQLDEFIMWHETKLKELEEKGHDQSTCFSPIICIVDSKDFAKFMKEN